MEVKVGNITYEIIKNYRNAFDKQLFLEKVTDYFDVYDYIFGDIAYNKLRLKGFCDKDNKFYKEINDIDKLESYIKEDCAYDCKYFLLKKL